jgi:hypothetical protein
MTVLEEQSQYKIHLVGVHEVRCDTGGTKQAGAYSFLFNTKRNENLELVMGFF